MNNCAPKCEYAARCTREGLAEREIQRCLKRNIVGELYPLILADLKESVRRHSHLPARFAESGSSVDAAAFP